VHRIGQLILLVAKRAVYKNVALEQIHKNLFLKEGAVFTKGLFQRWDIEG